MPFGTAANEDPTCLEGQLFNTGESIRETLERTGVLREPLKGQEMKSTLLVSDIKAANQMQRVLLMAWRTKGLEPDPSSPYEARLFCSHALTRQNLNRVARQAGL